MEKRFSNIVLNIPHASKIIPINTWESSIDMMLHEWTDTKTDELFKGEFLQVKSVVFPVSRFFCDFERLVDDPLEEQGQGIFYTKFDKAVRKKDKGVYDYAMTLYNNHKAFINSFINEGTLLIDCHSFPSHVAPNTDICIGFNEDWSKPSQELIDKVVNHFLSYGFNVDINNPYSNSITPKDSKDYKSLMIEVNKRNYLTPEGFLSNRGYELKSLINYLYKNILFRWNY